MTEELGHREDAMERKLEDSLRPARTLIVDAEDEARRNKAKLVEYVGDMQAGLVSGESAESAHSDYSVSRYRYSSFHSSAV